MRWPRAGSPIPVDLRFPSRARALDPASALASDQEKCQKIRSVTYFTHAPPDVSHFLTLMW
jgi:hypothetical protein